MEKLKMHTLNITDANIQKLAELFPHCVTEIKDEAGNPKKAIDFDMLKQELSKNIVEGTQERYQLNWVGKKEALLTANTPIAKTLRPSKEESVDFDTTQNLFIEGDNLDALKLLQESYLGEVHVIYIDPPYNTGRDFIYEDDFAEDSEVYKLRSNQVDENKNRLTANTESNGRFHSDWLSMMYARLKLAKNLLDDEGLIFISIGQEEIKNLRKIMDEIFGAENYRNTIAVKRGAKSVQAQFETWDKLGTAFEYILFYSKSSTYRFPKMMRDLDDSKTGGWNNHWRGTDRPSMRYELFGITPEHGQWRWSKQRSLTAIENYKTMLDSFNKDSTLVTQEDIDSWYLENDDDLDLLRLSNNNKPEHYIPPTDETLLNDVWFHLSSNGSRVIKNLFGKKVFDNPKPLELIQQVLKFAPKDALVLDFFAGSATSAHAVLELNAEDGGSRKFILVQIPEKCVETSNAYKAGFKNIAEVSKERIRLAGKSILESECNKSWNNDVGFRVLKVDTSNMADVFYNPDAISQDLLSDQVENIKPDRTSEDLLFQVLLDWGVDLTLPISRETIADKEVFFVAEDALAACFDNAINEDCLKEIAHKKPLRVVFRDSGFSSDSVKINVEQIFKLISPSTEIKTI